LFPAPHKSLSDKEIQDAEEYIEETGITIEEPCVSEDKCYKKKDGTYLEWQIFESIIRSYDYIKHVKECNARGDYTSYLRPPVKQETNYSNYEPTNVSPLVNQPLM